MKSKHEQIHRRLVARESRLAQERLARAALANRPIDCGLCHRKVHPDETVRARVSSVTGDRRDVFMCMRCRQQLTDENYSKQYNLSPADQSASESAARTGQPNQPKMGLLMRLEATK